MLRNLTVQNYRCFENFHIDGLEQVNLFVGNNNSGKTSLLEAIYLLFSRGTKYRLLEILLNRREVILENKLNRDDFKQISQIITIAHHVESVNHLFYNYELLPEHKIHIGGKCDNAENNSNPSIDIAYVCSENRSLSLIFSDNQEYPKNSKLESEFKIHYYDKTIKVENNDIYAIMHKGLSNHILLGNNQRELEELQLIWDNIYLTTKEDKVVQALQIIEPKIERIGFYNNQTYSAVRFKIKGYNHPIPLSSFGEGLNDLLTLIMSLATAENGILLVDEIETGLHYEAQIDMWRLVLETAKELNVQVFATTHSWDCIAAFQEALEQVEDQSIGKLFRLDSKYGKLRAVKYNAEDLEIAVRHSIEVR